MERFKSGLTSIDSSLKELSKKMGIDSRIKELMIMDYWKEIVKGNIRKDSRPYSITRAGNSLILNIAARNSTVVQELSMVKLFLKDQINTLALQVGIKISDIVISTKFWIEDAAESTAEASNSAKNDSIKYKDLEEINRIVLDKDQKLCIEKILDELDSQEDLKKCMMNILEKDMKLKKYKKQKSYPVCKGCGVLLNSLNQEYCPSCRF